MKGLLVVAIAVAVAAVMLGNALVLLLQPTAATAVYGLPAFPEPMIALPDSERDALAETAVRAVSPWRARGIEAMSEQRRDDGARAFVAEEIRHFEDVREIMNALIGAWVVGWIALIVAAFARVGGSLRTGVRTGLAATGAAFVVLGLAMLIAFEGFFEVFHVVLFEGDSWRLPDDGVVRSLFPDQYWATMGGAVAALVLAQAAALAVVLRRGPSSPG